MRKIVCLFMFLLLLSVGNVYAASSLDSRIGSASEPGVMSDDQYVWDTFDAARDDIVAIGTQTAQVQIPLTSAILNDQTSIEVLSESTAPGLEFDNAMAAIVWADGETTPIQVSFTVPADYGSAGVLKVLCADSASSTRNQVDFYTYVNSDDTAWDTAVTNQTPVALASTIATHPELVTLTPATDFASLAAGDVVILGLWRDDTADGSADLEMYGNAIFEYTRQQI